MSALFNDRLIIPGSLIFQNDLLLNLIVSRSEYINEGVLSLDLNERHSSFCEYAANKSLSYKHRQYGDFLDKVTVNVVRFQDAIIGKKFTDAMREVVIKALTLTFDTLSRDILFKNLDKINDSKNSLELKDAVKLGYGTLAEDWIRNVAYLIYCSLSTLPVVPQIPMSLFKKAIQHIPNDFTHIKDDNYFKAEMFHAAHSTIMDCFNVDHYAIAKLTASQILSLRDDIQIQRSKQIIGEIINEYESSMRFDKDMYKNAQAAINQIRGILAEKCTQEKDGSVPVLKI